VQVLAPLLADDPQVFTFGGLYPVTSAILA
jgi:hypothetical protein